MIWAACGSTRPSERLRAGSPRTGEGKERVERRAVRGGRGGLEPFDWLGCQGWLGSGWIEHGAGSRPRTPGCRRRKTGGAQTRPYAGWGRRVGGRVVGAAGGSLPGRGRLQTGPYVRLGRRDGGGGGRRAGQIPRPQEGLGTGRLRFLREERGCGVNWRAVYIRWPRVEGCAVAIAARGALGE